MKTSSRKTGSGVFVLADFRQETPDPFRRFSGPETGAMTFGRCVYAASLRRRHRYPSSPAAPVPSRARVEGSGTD